MKISIMANDGEIEITKKQNEYASKLTTNILALAYGLDPKILLLAMCYIIKMKNYNKGIPDHKFVKEMSIILNKMTVEED